MKRKVLFVVLLLTVSLLAACGGNGGAGGAVATPGAGATGQAPAAGQTPAAGQAAPAAAEWVPGTLPIVTEPTTFTIWQRTDLNVTAIMNSLEESEFWQEMERRTGVTIQFMHPPINEEQTALSLLLATGDFPDVLQMTPPGYQYPGGLDRGIADGIILCMRDIAETYAPNFWAAIHRDEETRRQAFTDEGHLPGFWQINYILQPPWNGMTTRQDWLDYLGLDTPVTFDDWEYVLTRFRNDMGADSPLMIPMTGFIQDHGFSAGFETAREFINVNGTVNWGPLQPGFRDYITMLNRWYTNGLIDQDFSTRAFGSSPPNEFKTTGRAGLWNDTYVVFPANANLAEDPNYRSVAVPTPRRYEGQILHLGQRNMPIGALWAVTSNNSDPVTFARWIDYKYSDEGMILSNFGVEGHTFEFDEQGNPAWNYRMYDNPDGLTVAQAVRRYTKHASGGFIHDWRRELTGATQDTLDALDIWSEGNTFAWNMPRVTLTDSESTEFVRIMADIDTYRDEMVVRFITGQTPLSEIDSFIDTVHAMGIERAIEIQQAALERFLAR